MSNELLKQIDMLVHQLHLRDQAIQKLQYEYQELEQKYKLLVAATSGSRFPNPNTSSLLLPPPSTPTSVTPPPSRSPIVTGPLSNSSSSSSSSYEIGFDELFSRSSMSGMSSSAPPNLAANPSSSSTGSFLVPPNLRRVPSPDPASTHSPNNPVRVSSTKLPSLSTFHLPSSSSSSSSASTSPSSPSILQSQYNQNIIDPSLISGRPSNISVVPIDFNVSSHSTFEFIQSGGFSPRELPVTSGTHGEYPSEFPIKKTPNDLSQMMQQVRPNQIRHVSSTPDMISVMMPNNPPNHLHNIVSSEKNLKQSKSWSGPRKQDKKILSSLQGHMLTYATSQKGCRMLQKILEDNPPEAFGLIFSELLEHLDKLLIDQFGNYVFIRLFECCSNDQRDLVLEQIRPVMIKSATNQFGTQALQKILPFLSSRQIDLMVNTLHPELLPLIKDQKSNYLIQHLLDKTNAPSVHLIYDTISENVQHLSMDRVGCVVLKKAIQLGTQVFKEKVLKAITDIALILVKDPYGNYVIQHILEHFTDPFSLISKFKGNLVSLSQNKCSSNVIECCLRSAPPKLADEMIQELADSPDFPNLLIHKFANFVIQTALEIATPQSRELLTSRIRPHLGKLQGAFIKRIEKRLSSIDN